jgi:sugar phosphate isomerase/epimerase
LHDNNGGTAVKDYLHLPIGEGSIDFTAILDALYAKGYEGGFSFELKPEHVRRGRQVVQGIWEAAAAKKDFGRSEIA